MHEGAHVEPATHAYIQYTQYSGGSVHEQANGTNEAANRRVEGTSIR